MNVMTAPQGSTPSLGPTGKPLIGARALLEWAFATECAGLDYDEIGATSQSQRPGIGMEYRLMQQAQLGVARIDTSVGRSLPHDDAEVVATVLRNSVHWHLAVHVADLARRCQVPDWMPAPKPRCRPVEWRHCKHGAKAMRDFWRGNGRWSGVHLGRDGGYACPVFYTDTAADVARARRAYLDWWGALLAVLGGLRGVVLTKFDLSDRMPPMTPWQ